VYTHVRHAMLASFWPIGANGTLSRTVPTSVPSARLTPLPSEGCVDELASSAAAALIGCTGCAPGGSPRWQPIKSAHHGDAARRRKNHRARAKIITAKRFRHDALAMSRVAGNAALTRTRSKRRLQSGRRAL
jgi:hypothetical protein